MCEKTNKNMQDINQNKDCKRVKQALTKPKHIVLVKKPALTTVLSPNVHLWSSRPELFLERETWSIQIPAKLTAICLPNSHRAEPRQHLCTSLTSPRWFLQNYSLLYISLKTYFMWLTITSNCQYANKKIHKLISYPSPKIQSENKFSAFLQVRKLVWDTLLLYLVWLSQPMLKHICFALVCEKTCTREIKAPEKKQHKRIIKIQWNLLSWNASDVPLSINISSHVIHSCFPLSNPSSWLSARQLFQLPVPLWSRQRCKAPSCRQDHIQTFPFPSSHSPHRKANRAVSSWGWTAPIGTHFWKTDSSMLPLFKHCPIQYLADRPKAAGALLLQRQLQNGPLSPGFFGQQKYQSKAQSEQVIDVPAPCLDRPSCPYSNPKL